MRRVSLVCAGVEFRLRFTKRRLRIVTGLCVPELVFKPAARAKAARAFSSPARAAPLSAFCKSASSENNGELFDLVALGPLHFD